MLFALLLVAFTDSPFDPSNFASWFELFTALNFAYAGFVHKPAEGKQKADSDHFKFLIRDESVILKTFTSYVINKFDRLEILGYMTPKSKKLLDQIHNRMNSLKERNEEFGSFYLGFSQPFVIAGSYGLLALAWIGAHKLFELKDDLICNIFWEITPAILILSIWCFVNSLRRTKVGVSPSPWITLILIGATFVFCIVDGSTICNLAKLILPLSIFGNNYEWMLGSLLVIFPYAVIIIRAIIRSSFYLVSGVWIVIYILPTILNRRRIIDKMSHCEEFAQEVADKLNPL